MGFTPVFSIIYQINQALSAQQYNCNSNNLCVGTHRLISENKISSLLLLQTVCISNGNHQQRSSELKTSIIISISRPGISSGVDKVSLSSDRTFRLRQAALNVVSIKCLRDSFYAFHSLLEAIVLVREGQNRQYRPCSSTAFFVNLSLKAVAK